MAHVIEKEQLKHINNGHTDIIEVCKKEQDTVTPCLMPV